MTGIYSPSRTNKVAFIQVTKYQRNYANKKLQEKYSIRRGELLLQEIAVKVNFGLQ
jgi:hypothetical protein